MATTPNYALRYPALSDAPNVPQDLQNLATDTDSALLSVYNLLKPLYALKTSNESVPNTTLQDDDQLFLAYASGKTYELSGLLILGIAGTGDVKGAFTFTAAAGTVLHWGGFGPDVSAVSYSGPGIWFIRDNQTTSPTGTISWNTSASAPAAVPIHGLFKTGSTGTLRLQWAQDVSNATAAVIQAGSWLKLTPVN